MAKKCPWIIPHFEITQTEEGMKRNGFKRMNERWEDITVYSERQSGIFAVYMATMLHLPRPVGELGKSRLWIWVAEMLNATPRSDIAYTIMSTYFDIAGQSFVELYGRQARKCIEIAFGPWAKDGQGPRWSRFMVVGEDWKDGGLGGINHDMEP